MKTRTKLFLFLIIVLVAYGLYSGAFTGMAVYSKEVVNDFQKEENLPEIPPECKNCISIANWNIQTFGAAKWESSGERILEILPNYDIIFIQEIRDKSGESFDSLCNDLQGYKCAISSRAGRTSSKEQYGIVYRRDIEIENIIDYNLDPRANELWERPPVRVDFKVNNYDFSAYNIHTKPDDAGREMEYLESLVSREENNDDVIILGDLNADGFYYDEDSISIFKDYKWIIDNSMDTTVAKSDNTYDRIILNKDMNREYKSKGAYKDITEDISDHYPVWVQIKIS